jgi:3-oxoacyl-[acyl-carrier protein] reductase
VATLTGRTAVVTGVSRRAGIGFAIAQRLIADGAQVFVQSYTPHDREQPWGADPGGIEAVLAELGRPGHLELDLSGADAPARLMTTAAERLGHVDILVANHARSGNGRLDQLTAEQLDGFLAVNVRATLLLVKEFAARRDGYAGGRVVMLTSGQHLGAMSPEIAYAVSKGAIHQATASLADELADRGITVNTVNPGPTDTGWPTPQAHAAVLAQMPRGRWGQPDDAARLIAWLCSDDAEWITGQVINSEGGFRR